MTPTNTQPDALRLAEEREAFEATMKTHFPGWSFASDGCGGYHNFTADAAWVAWQARAEVEKLRQGGEAVANEKCQLRACDQSTGKEYFIRYGERAELQAEADKMNAMGRDYFVWPLASAPLQADACRYPDCKCPTENPCLKGLPQADAVAWLRTSGTGSPVCTEEFLKAHPEYRDEYEQPLVKPVQADACKVPQGFDEEFERKAFEKEHDIFNLAKHPQHGFYIDKMTQSYWEGWIGRAMLSASPAAPTQAEHGEAAYTAGLESSTGHLSALVDDLRRLMARAMAEMKALEESAKPVNEPRGDFDALIPYEKWGKFVDGRAALLHAIHESPHELPAAPTQVETQAKEVALNTTHEDCHKAADAFWQYWRENGVPHKKGYYESTWGAINQALRYVGVKPHVYLKPRIEVAGTSYLSDCIESTPSTKGDKS